MRTNMGKVWIAICFQIILVTISTSLSARHNMDTLPCPADTLPAIDTPFILIERIDTPTIGIASYYADRFEGRKTSSGEVFRQRKMTAAHNHLPLGTWIRVTHLQEGSQVIVKVNDRMHPLNRRLVDLSKAAARKLGYLVDGLATVRVEVLGMQPPEDGFWDP